MDSIEGVFGDKWFNLKESTRQAIDYICFLSIERGFVWASPDHIATKHGIGKSTVYDALKVLREEDILFKANRCSKKQNGLGCSMHFFTIHPYFDHIKGFLNIDWNPKQKADRKAEIPEIPHHTGDLGDSQTPTLSLPSHDIKDIDLQSNVLPIGQSKLSTTTIIKYVPKFLNEVYANVFGFRLRFIWQKITQAYKSIKQSVLNKEDLNTIGRSVVQRLLQVWKDHNRDNKEMTVDEMCAFVYTSARESFYNTIAEVFMEDLPEIEEMRELRLEQFEEAKNEIAFLEDACVSKYPYASPTFIRLSVMEDMPKVFPLLLEYDLVKLEQCYDQCSSF